MDELKVGDKVFLEPYGEGEVFFVEHSPEYNPIYALRFSDETRSSDITMRAATEKALEYRQAWLQRQEESTEGLIHINEKLNKKIAELEETKRNLDSELEDYKHIVERRNTKIAELEKRKRIALCIWCGDRVDIGDDKEKAYTIMRGHDLNCLANPHVQRIAKLKAEIEQLKVEAEIPPILEKGVITLAEVHEQLQKAKAKIEQLKKEMQNAYEDGYESGYAHCKNENPPQAEGE